LFEWIPLSSRKLNTVFTYRRFDNSDKNKRIMERIKWRETATVASRIDAAFGRGSSQMRMPPSPPSQAIWRSASAYQRDPPPLNDRRGSKRKSSSSGEERKKRSKARRSREGSSRSREGSSRSRHLLRQEDENLRW